MNRRITLIVRIISILCILAMVSGILLTFLYADSDMPTDWAQEDVKKAIEMGIVPQELQSNYSTPIKRNEYTSLALNLYKKSGNQIIISESNVFTDIEGDYYQRQLIEAYNARIIGGYPDKTFRPANDISREEISKLIVNLITAIFPNDELEIADNYDFTDKSLVEEWAIPYINYCYNQQIMKGIAPMTISPKVATTREQAIIMIYRIAVSRDVLNQRRTSVNVDFIDKQIDYQNNNLSLIDVLYYISEPGFYDILQSSEEKLIIKSQSDIYYIKMSKKDGKLLMSAETKNSSDIEFKFLLINLLKASKYSQKATNLFTSNLDIASQTGKIYFGEQKDSEYLMNGYTIDDSDNTRTFVFMLEEY